VSWNEGEEATRGDTLFWTVGVASMQISVLRKNLHSFGNV